MHMHGCDTLLVFSMERDPVNGSESLDQNPLDQNPWIRIPNGCSEIDSVTLHERGNNYSIPSMTRALHNNSGFGRRAEAVRSS